LKLFRFIIVIFFSHQLFLVKFFVFFFTVLGCGFIGRHLVKYLVDNDLVSAVRVVDKVPPQIAWLNEDHRAAFESPIVEFHSANLINQSINFLLTRYFIKNILI